MVSVRLPAITVLVLAIAACTGAAPSPFAPTPAASDPLATQGSANAPAVRIDVKLSDALRIEPASMSVPAGGPVTFVVTNTGSTNHEFFVGDDIAQMDHDREMRGMEGMTHDEAMGIGLMPGETKRLTVTFTTAGTVSAGCHVSGHYAAGMKASIRVSG